MPWRRALLFFVLALAAFLAIGTGALLLAAPDLLPVLAGRTGTSTEQMSDDEPEQDAARSGAAMVEWGEGVATEFALVAGACSVPRPDQPRRIAIPSVALDARVVEVAIVVEQGKPE